MISIVFIAAGGLIFLVHRPTEGNSFRDWARIGAGGMIVFLLAVSSTVLLGQTTDLNLTRYLGEQNRHYFEESELVAFDIASGHRGATVLFTDYHSSRYVENHFEYPVRRSPEVLEPDVAASGSLLYRQGEFDDRGELTFCLGWAGGTDRMYYYRTEDDIDLQGRWEQEEKLLDTGTVILYRKNPGD